MLRFGEAKTAKKVLCSKEAINIWGVNVGNVVISKLVKTKTTSKYLIGYLNKVTRPLVLIMPKTTRYVKTFKVKDGYKKNKQNWYLSV